MRTLTSRQKKLLNQWNESYEAINGDKMTGADDLSDVGYQMLVDLNDSEILWQEVNRYLSDIQMESIYGNK